MLLDVLQIDLQQFHYDTIKINQRSEKLKNRTYRTSSNDTTFTFGVNVSAPTENEVKCLQAHWDDSGVCDKVMHPSVSHSPDVCHI